MKLHPYHATGFASILDIKEEEEETCVANARSGMLAEMATSWHNALLLFTYERDQPWIREETEWIFVHLFFPCWFPLILSIFITGSLLLILVLFISSWPPSVKMEKGCIFFLFKLCFFLVVARASGGMKPTVRCVPCFFPISLTLLSWFLFGV